MAAGTPVVASGIDGYRNVATDGVDALLPPPGDVDALVKALGEVLRDGALAGALRADGAPAGRRLRHDDAGRGVRAHLPRPDRRRRRDGGAAAPALVAPPAGSHG